MKNERINGNYFVFLSQLLEIENYINSKGRVAFEDVTLKGRTQSNTYEKHSYISKTGNRFPYSVKRKNYQV